MSRLRLIAALVLALAAPLLVAQTPLPSPLEEGYRDMYNLQFNDAHKAFQQWQQGHPDDPMGPVSSAAAYLFAEFDRLHILESELFVNDQAFENRSRPAPDPRVKQQFNAELDQAKRLTAAQLSRNPKDANALFSNVLALGLQGDYLALIEKRDFQALSLMKQGRALAEQLLSAYPSYYDAYLAVGVENYLLSLKPAPVRWFLRNTGAQTDKSTGIEKLRITAEKGHYLLPYARLLLAVAALRDKDREQARSLLQGLATTFPQNHLYRSELAKLH